MQTREPPLSISQPSLTHFSFKLDSFRLNLSNQSDKFVIQAEREDILKYYQQELDSEQLTRISYGLLTSASEAIETLMTFKEKSSNLSIEIDEGAELTIACWTQVGNKMKEIKFNIQLEEIDFKPLDIVLKCIMKLEEVGKESLPISNRKIALIMRKMIEYSRQMENQVSDLSERLKLLEAMSKG